MKPRLIAIGLLLGALGVGACSREAARPNLILISLDTVRADHLGLYGYARPTTPNLDAFAREGVVFEKAFAQIPWTVGSHMSLLTSLYPTVHMVAHEERQSEVPRTLTEQLKGAGYRTAAFVAPILSEGYGFAKGFDHYFRAAEERRAESMLSRALGWLDELSPDPKQPVFLFIHLYDAHYPYLPLPPFDTSFTRSYDPKIQEIAHAHPYQQAKELSAGQLAEVIALYDGEIRYLDQELGRFLAALRERKLVDSSLIVVTADHGEGFLEHGLMNHGNSVYEELIRVPLLLRFPGARHKGRRVAALAQLIDVAPTVLEEASAGALPGMQGVSLLPRMKRGEAPPFAYSAGAYASSLRTDAFKLIENPAERFTKIPRSVKAPYELYDLRDDPGETTNLAASQPQLQERLAQALRKLDQDNRSLRDTLRQGRKAETLELTDEQKQQLRALGYVE